MASGGLYTPKVATPHTGIFPACTPRPSPSLPLNTIDRRSPVIRLTPSCIPRRSSRPLHPLFDSHPMQAERSLRIGIRCNLLSLRPSEMSIFGRATSAAPGWIFVLRLHDAWAGTTPSTMPAQKRDRRLEGTSPDPTPLRHPCRCSQADTQRPLLIEARPTLLGLYWLAYRSPPTTDVWLHAQAPRCQVIRSLPRCDPCRRGQADM